MDHFKMVEICNNILTQMNEDDEFKYFINNTDKDIFVTVKVETSQEHITISDSLINIKCRIHGLAFDTFIIVKNNSSLLEEDKNLKIKANKVTVGLTNNVLEFNFVGMFSYLLNNLFIELGYYKNYYIQNFRNYQNTIAPLPDSQSISEKDIHQNMTKIIFR